MDKAHIELHARSPGLPGPLMFALSVGVPIEKNGDITYFQSNQFKSSEISIFRIYNTCFFNFVSVP